MPVRTDILHVANRLGRSSIGVVAIVVCALSAVHCQATPTSVAFRFEEDALTLPSSVLTAIGGPLTDAEAQTIKATCREELETAFTGLRLRVVEGEDGFWRVVIVQSVPNPGPLPNAGTALPLGPLGGTALVGSDIVASEAVRYAPPGASRQTIIEGIGRGIGRVAAHEVAHQIVGAGGKHNEADEHSYEYPSPARAAQYYGKLHWTVWWPDLQRRVGQ